MGQSMSAHPTPPPTCSMQRAIGGHLGVLQSLWSEPRPAPRALVRIRSRFGAGWNSVGPFGDPDAGGYSTVVCGHASKIGSISEEEAGSLHGLERASWQIRG